MGAPVPLRLGFTREMKLEVKKYGRDVTPAVERVEMVVQNGAILEVTLFVRKGDEVEAEVWK